MRVISRVLPGFNFLLGSESDPRLILDALRAITDVKVLSTPSVVVLDNQVATLQVGDQIPVTTGTATVLDAGAPIVNNIDYRNTGVILRVVPRINVNGNVLLDVEQEISNVAANHRRHADADSIAAQGEELDRGRQRPDRAAGRPDQRTAGARPDPAFPCSNSSTVGRRVLASDKSTSAPN